MKLYQIFFSPTGGTKKIADIISQPWDCEKEFIDLMEPGQDISYPAFTQEDICIIAVPSFGGRVPEIALRKLRAMKGGNASAILAAVYGNRAFEDTLIELKDTLLEAGFSIAGAIGAVAQHSIFPQFGTGRPDKDDIEELIGFARQIKASIEQGALLDAPPMPGNRPYKEFHVIPMNPRGHKCSHCGICAQQCPVQAIPMENPGSVIKELCISCMHCVFVCPQHTRKLDSLFLSAAGLKMKKVCSGRKENQLFQGAEAMDSLNKE
ncbi:MAG: 4Fe-4S binding protein [Lachnospiraceae bacterium]|jgi:ferredoxin/flavodoxin|nr:4Fe-4S binding protein [Lachnospiraceae bacterium]